jgi:hypothetical protein
MEIYIDIWVEDRESGNKTKANEAIYTFVAVDDTGRPVEVPQVIPETELEIQRYEAALRRTIKFSLAKIKPSRCYRAESIIFVKSFFETIFFLKSKFTSKKVFLQAKI